MVARNRVILKRVIVSRLWADWVNGPSRDWDLSLAISDDQERQCLEAVAYAAKEKGLPAGWSMPITYADGDKLLRFGRVHPDLTPVKQGSTEYLVSLRGHLFRGNVVDCVADFSAYAHMPTPLLNARSRVGVSASLRALTIIRSTHPDIEELLRA